MPNAPLSFLRFVLGFTLLLGVGLLIVAVAAPFAKEELAEPAGEPSGAQSAAAHTAGTASHSGETQE